MPLTAEPTSVAEILPWRDLYRHEMSCQIVQDSFHGREGWTQPYRLLADGEPAGYASVIIGGPWEGEPTVFEFYVLPRFRTRAFGLFEALIGAAGPVAVRTQTNDALLTVMLHTYCGGIETEKILFGDSADTHHPLNGAQFRKAAPDDDRSAFTGREEPDGDWVLAFGGRVVAAGGLLFHYNRPYGDLYMEVAEPFRLQGYGTCIVQELKRACYEQGSTPAARCNPDNVGSRRTLQKAGFVPVASLLNGKLRPDGR